MDKKVSSAQSLRSRAWQKLGENGGWTVAIFGGLCAFVIPYFINSPFQRAIGWDALSALAKDVQSGHAALEPFLAMLPQFLLFASGALLVAYYLSAVFAYGLAALSIAIMRGGGKVGHVFTGFAKGWSTLWMMALAELYVFCWSLCLVIPGICAAFSYTLKYLVKADHPDWSAQQCIGESKRLMAGNRWRFFGLWLSFLPWWLLCFATIGLALFFVLPYFRTAEAAFYEDLLDR